jgi:hypothetical protein
MKQSLFVINASIKFQVYKNQNFEVSSQSSLINIYLKSQKTFFILQKTKIIPNLDFINKKITPFKI